MPPPTQLRRLLFEPVPGHPFYITRGTGSNTRMRACVCTHTHGRVYNCVLMFSTHTNAVNHAFSLCIVGRTHVNRRTSSKVCPHIHRAKPIHKLINSVYYKHRTNSALVAAEMSKFEVLTIHRVTSTCQILTFTKVILKYSGGPSYNLDCTQN